MADRTRITFDDSEGPDWVIEYSLGYDAFDDSLDNNDTVEVIVSAADFDTAVRYAQQYLRKMQTEDATADMWQDAEILAVELH